MFRNIDSWIRGLSIRTKVTLGIALPLIIILSITTVIEYNRHRQTVLTNLSFLASKSNQLIENSLLHEMVNRDIEGLQEMLDEIGKEPSIRSVYLLDTKGEIIFAPNAEQVGTFLDNSDPTCQGCHSLNAEERPGSLVVSLSGGQRIFRSMIPIENRPTCYDCHNPNQQTIGLLLTDIWMEPLENPLRFDLLENILWRAATILVAILVANLALSNIVLDRIEGLSRSIRQFRKEKIDLYLSDKSRDEIGQLTASFQDMRSRINSEVAENRALSENLRKQSAHRGELLRRLTNAQEEERKRIARDLHDELGQVLSAVSLKLKLVEKLFPSDNNRINQELREARNLIRDTSDHMYELIFALRPSILDDIGLVAALKEYLNRISNETGVIYELIIDDLSIRLPSAIEVTLYRIFQEAITNIVKYSQSKDIKIELVVSDSIFHGEIADSGIGFDTNSASIQGDKPVGFGLLGMRERVSQLDGQIELFSRPGKGTCIRIHLPIYEGLNE